MTVNEPEVSPKTVQQSQIKAEASATAAEAAKARAPLQDLLQQPFMQSAIKHSTFRKGLVNWINKVFRTSFYASDIDLLKRLVAEDNNK